MPPGPGPQVDTNLNGLQRDPTLFGSPTFTEYNLHEIRLFSLKPSAGPIAQASVITISGQNFKVLGKDQLVCQVGNDLQVTIVWRR